MFLWHILNMFKYECFNFYKELITEKMMMLHNILNAMLFETKRKVKLP